MQYKIVDKRREEVIRVMLVLREGGGMLMSQKQVRVSNKEVDYLEWRPGRGTPRTSCAS
jgi:hypothetical protein